ncbi:uncharacterized protein DUF4128 [Mesorhizobium sp. J18]|uniref:DUF4128 domain-containing protein n=1 Tax=Mesorhizobium sp. J18 TaxID=935263 RepID=UPI0011992BB3|nr:DUF4128 domain-containing protein [Mesorhizobium sp. J18]TWG90319.1 uncharacterized protein DUF4128 [Mesorhizobium sp. J18]
MPTIETSIWLALKARVQSLVLSPALPVAWPNESFDAPLSGYLRVTWIPNINRRLFLRGSDPHQRLSLLQVDVFGKKNQNVSVALEIAGKVAAHFPADLRMTAEGVTARVVRAPEIAQPIADDTHVQVPVTISIEAIV